MRAEAAAILLSTVRVYTQADVRVSMEWAKIQPALSGRSGSIIKNLQVADVQIARLSGCR